MCMNGARTGFRRGHHTHRNDGFKRHIHGHIQFDGVGLAYEKIKTVHRARRGRDEHRDIFFIEPAAHLAGNAGLERQRPGLRMGIAHQQHLAE